MGKELFLDLRWQSQRHSLRVDDIGIQTLGLKPDLMYTIWKTKNFRLKWWTVPRHRNNQHDQEAITMRGLIVSCNSQDQCNIFSYWSSLVPSETTCNSLCKYSICPCYHCLNCPSPRGLPTYRTLDCKPLRTPTYLFATNASLWSAVYINKYAYTCWYYIFAVTRTGIIRTGFIQRLSIPKTYVA